VVSQYVLEAAKVYLNECEPNYSGVATFPEIFIEVDLAWPTII